MTDHVRPIDAKRVHEPDEIGRHAFHRVGRLGAIALADAAVVVRDDIEAAGEASNLLAPERGLAAETTDENDGKASAFTLVVDMAIADGGSRHLNREETIPAPKVSNVAVKGLPCTTVIAAAGLSQFHPLPRVNVRNHGSTTAFSLPAGEPRENGTARDGFTTALRQTDKAGQ